MALVNEGGALRVVGGALGTGQACCCNKCSGPCPNGVEDCAPGCGCKDSQCVPCSGPCECAEQDFACSVIFFDTEEEANQFCQDPARVFRNCDIYDPEVNPLPDQGERWGVDYCECTAPSVCPEGCVCVNGQCVQGGACCLPERCVYGASVALLVSRLNGGPAPELAGWVLVGQSEPTFGTVGCTYNFYTQDAPCDLFTEPWQAALDDFNAKILEAAAGLGYTEEELSSLEQNLGSLTATVEAASCEDGLTQSACEEQGGTYHPGQTCAEEPCCTCAVPDYCTLTIFSDFGDFVIDWQSSPASGFLPGEEPCSVNFNVQDVGYEGGGDITGTVVFGSGANCCPVIESFTFGRSGDCSDPAVSCWPIDARLDCPDPCPPNPLP